MGNKTESIQHYNQYLVIQDSIKDLEVTRNLERFHFESEIQKRELENKLSRTQNEAILQTARLQNVILSLVLIFAVTIVIILWINNKKKQSANKKLQDQNELLEELNHEKDTLMNIVAHDLKSPLNRISGLTQLLEKDGNPQSTKEYLDIIKKTTKSGLTLIADLLDLNAVSESKLKPDYKETDIQKIIDVRVESYKQAAGAKNITINKEYGDERIPEMRSLLEQISPLNNVDRIDVPLLVVQGRNDPRVPASESEQIVRAMRERDRPVWYIEALNEGHGYSRKENIDVYEQATILFLQQYLVQ
jgi:signal transduction histidine kinase